MVSTAAMVDRLLAGDTRATARAISLLEAGTRRGHDLLRAVHDRSATRTAPVGLTGAPGVGKSTLVNALTIDARRRGRRVAIVAVDPSSTRSGGAFLGDRIRMLDLVMDGGVYMRSVGSRGDSGGLSVATGGIVDLLARLPFDEVLVESVGIGQIEPDIRTVVDTTVVVVSPGGGDDIQVQKAGTSEGADVFAVNKADLAGADALARAIAQSMAMGRAASWSPPVVCTVAHDVDSVAALWAAIGDHRAHLAQQGGGGDRVASRLRARVARMVGSAATSWAAARLDADPELAARLAAGDPPSLVAQRLLGDLVPALGGRAGDPDILPAGPAEQPLGADPADWPQSAAADQPQDTGPPAADSEAPVGAGAAPTLHPPDERSPR